MDAILTITVISIKGNFVEIEIKFADNVKQTVWLGVGDMATLPVDYDKQTGEG